MSVCVCCREMEISGKRIKVLEADRFRVLFWQTWTMAPKVEAFCQFVWHPTGFTSVSARRRYECVFNLCVSLGVCVQLFTEPVYVSQARRGGGEVPRSASASSADVSGQTNHQQRDGAREDEESRAADAATKPCSGETSNTPHVQPDRPWGCYILCRAACRHLGHRVLII